MAFRQSRCAASGLASHPQCAVHQAMYLTSAPAEEADRNAQLPIMQVMRGVPQGSWCGMRPLLPCSPTFDMHHTGRPIPPHTLRSNAKGTIKHNHTISSACSTHTQHMTSQVHVCHTIGMGYHIITVSHSRWQHRQPLLLLPFP